MALAAVMSALGSGLILLPLIAEDFTRGGYDPRLRFLLGACHIAGGVSLLVPRLAERSTVFLGLFVVGGIFYFLPKVEGPPVWRPILMSLSLLLLGVCLHLRHHADLSAWMAKLAAYADREESSRSRRT